MTYQKMLNIRDLLNSPTYEVFTTQLPDLEKTLNELHEKKYDIISTMHTSARIIVVAKKIE